MVVLPVSSDPTRRWSEWDLFFLASVRTVVRLLGLVSAGRRRPSSGGSPSRSRGAHPAARALLASLEELEVVHHHDQLRALLPILVKPLVQSQVSLDERLVPLAKALRRKVGLSALLTAVEDLQVEENGVIDELPGLGVLLAVVHCETELRHLSAGREGPHFRVARQATDQHHFVQVGHEALSCARNETLHLAEIDRINQVDVLYIRPPVKSKPRSLSGCLF